MKRRRFFQQVVGDGISLLEEITGRPQLRLTDLWQYPDEALLSLRPVFVPGVTVFALDGRMEGRRGSGTPVDLYGLDDAETFVLSRFDGRSRLLEIAGELVSARGWDAARARDLAKAVFLRLVGLGLCAPSDAMRDGIPATARNDSSFEGDDHE